MGFQQVNATPAAIALIRRLRAAHGPLLFHQSGGCCDGSAPMCYPRGEFRIGSRDVLLGTIDDCEVYIGGDQYELWKHTTLTIDAVPGRGAGFSLESPEGMRFLTRSTMCSIDELAALAKDPPRRGPGDDSGA
jgi:uncharacterized protein (DUF779 family)